MPLRMGILAVHNAHSGHMIDNLSRRQIEEIATAIISTVPVNGQSDKKQKTSLSTLPVNKLQLQATGRCPLSFRGSLDGGCGCFLLELFLEFWHVFAIQSPIVVDLLLLFDVTVQLSNVRQIRIALLVIRIGTYEKNTSSFLNYFYCIVSLGSGVSSDASLPSGKKRH